MGCGLQQLSPVFTSLMPTGESINPMTKSNWENVGVEPDVIVPAEISLTETSTSAALAS